MALLINLILIVILSLLVVPLVILIKSLFTEELEEENKRLKQEIEFLEEERDHYERRIKEFDEWKKKETIMNVE